MRRAVGFSVIFELSRSKIVYVMFVYKALWPMSRSMHYMSNLPLSHLFALWVD